MCVSKFNGNPGTGPMPMSLSFLIKEGKRKTSQILCNMEVPKTISIFLLQYWIPEINVGIFMLKIRCLFTGLLISCGAFKHVDRVAVNPYLASR
jgi:hypothetical protein